MPIINKLVFALLVVFVVGYFSVFKVDQWEDAIVFKFRKIDKSDYEPGLHFMLPFINTVQKFEKRLLNFDQEPQRFLTYEKKDVIVDYFVKWRIIDVEKFYQATRGNIRDANDLLGQRINSALRDEFGARTVQEVVAGNRSEMFGVIKKTTSSLPDELGILVIDVRTIRIDLPSEVSNSVYERMRAERNRVAKDFRARGAEEAERIRARTDREREIILADAYRDAEIKRGEGDAKAIDIYASAYSKDEEFYSLYRSLNAYKNSFGNSNDIMLIEPKSKFFKYFNNSEEK